MDKVITSLTVLLTGFVVVFLVLLLLIGIIKLYSSIVSGAEKAAKESKSRKAAKASPADSAPKPEKKPVAPVEKSAPAVDGDIPEEVIAVIAAAVDSVCGDGASKRVKSIKKSTSSSRGAWGNAGLMQNTRPF